MFTLNLPPPPDLAVQFASKMGCEVVVFSGSDHKRDEAIKLGAKEFVATKGVKDLKEKVSVPLDVLIITTSSQPDWNLYFPILASQAMVFPLSVDPKNPLTVPYMYVAAPRPLPIPLIFPPLTRRPVAGRSCSRASVSRDQWWRVGRRIVRCCGSPPCTKSSPSS